MPEIDIKEVRHLIERYSTLSKEIRDAKPAAPLDFRNQQASYLNATKPQIIHTEYGTGTIASFDPKEDKLWGAFKSGSRCIRPFSEKIANGTLKINDEGFYSLKPQELINHALLSAKKEECTSIESTLNSYGFTKLDRYGRPIYTKYSSDGFYDKQGFNIDHIHYNGSKFDTNGRDYEGYNQNGFDIDGFNRQGINQNGTRLSNTNLAFGRIPPDYFTPQTDGHYIRHLIKYEFNQTSYGVGIFIPSSTFNNEYQYYTTETQQLSQLISKYKRDHINEAGMRNTFNDLMSKALLKLLWQLNITGDVCLVSVPSSKIRRPDRPISLSDYFIKYITRQNTNYNLIDGSGILLRIKDNDPAHYGNHSIKQHLNTIQCQSPLDPNATYIIIDDIITTGNTLAACTFLLKNAGIPYAHIHRLALLATRDKEYRNPYIK